MDTAYLAAAYADESQYRENHRGWGAVDLALATQGIFATSILEGIQTESQKYPFLAQGSQDLLVRVGSTNLVDWKAVGVAATAWAATNATHRIISAIKLPQEFDKSMDAIALSDGFTPATVRETRRRRLTTRAVRGVGTLAVGAAAYALGEVENFEQAVYTSMGFTTASVLAIMGSKVAAGIHRLRRRQRA